MLPQFVDEQVQAKYLLTLVAQAWQKGVSRVFIYQLVNDSLDESNWTRGLGLLEFDWSRKPAADAFHYLTTTLQSGSASRAASGASALDYDISTPKAGSASLLIRKADGTFDVLVWKEQKIWDGNARKEIPADSFRVSLTLPPGYSRVQVVDPLNGRRQTVSLNSGHFEFDLGDHPLIVETAAGSG